MSRFKSLAFACLVFPLVGQAAEPLNIATFRQPDASSTYFWDINNSGVIVGFSVFGPAQNSNNQAFIYSAGAYTSLVGPTGASFTDALGISDRNEVVGSWRGPSSIDPVTGEVVLAPSQGYLYSAGTYTAVNVPGASSTFPRAISPDGRYISGIFDDEVNVARGFVLDTVTSVISMVGAGGSNVTIAQGVNNAGLLVGSDRVAGGRAKGFTLNLQTGVRTDYATPSFATTAFRAINESGEISGWLSNSTPGSTVGFTGGPDGRQTFSVEGFDATYAQGNNNWGALVGQVTLSDGSTMGFLASPVPEPAAWLLMSAGLALLAVRRQR
jgi:hypothetical protein